MKVSSAMRETLRSVEAGEVVRHYVNNGNKLKGRTGISSALLWKLHEMKLIEDGPKSKGVFVTKCVQVLTDAGRATLLDNVVQLPVIRVERMSDDADHPAPAAQGE